MKKQILFAIALFFALALIMGVMAALQITSSDTFSGTHNSHISIPVVVSNDAAVDITNVSMKITRITNQSDWMSIDITNESKKTIAANSDQSYSIDNYAIPQYTYNGSYDVIINVSGNQSGTPVSATKTVSITVNESKGMSASASKVTVSAATGTTTQTSFTITNTGNVNLTNIAITQQSTLNDSDSNIITLSITSNKDLQSLKPGETAVIYIDASVPKAQQKKTYITNLVINSTENIGATVAYEVDIKETYCSLGNKGSDFSVSIKDPDDGDDFYPNDEIPVTVRVNNYNDDDRDIVVEADLYDETDNQFLDVEYSTDATIDDDSSEDFEFTLKVPLDTSNTHDYKIFAKVYEDGNEEEQCKEDYVTIDIKKESHSLLINKVEMLSTAACGDSFDVDVKLANAGKNDEEDIKVQVINSELGINEEKLVDIDKEETRTVSLVVKVPKDAVEKDYTFTIRAYFYYSNDEYNRDVTTTKPITVGGNCLTPTENVVVNAEVLSQPYVAEQLGIKVTLFNTGTVTNTYSIIALNFETWAQLDKTEPAALIIEAGQSAASYIYLTPFQNTAGPHSITIKAVFGSKKIEKTLNLEVQEKSTATGTYKSIIQRLSNLSGFDLATVNIILGVAIILVFIWIMRVRRAY